MTYYSLILMLFLVGCNSDRPTREQCNKVCYPHYHYTSLVNNQCVCDLTKEVKEAK